MPTVGQRPASISLGTAVSPTPLVLLARLGNPTVTGGVQPAISTSPLRLIPTLPNPSLARGHATRIDLVEGTGIRATWFRGPTAIDETHSLAITQAQLDAITNWADLRLRVTATGETGRTAVSWAELAVPVGAAGLTVSATALRLIPTLPNVSASVGGSPPVAVIGSPPGPTFSIQAGQTITFDPVGTNDDAAWGGTWNFGDGTTHTGTFNNYASHVVQKAYSTPGTYLVTWTVLDAEGNSDVATLTVEVTDLTSVPTTLQVAPSSFALSPGQQRTLDAVVLDQFGNPMTGQVIGWVSSNTARATVAPSTGDSTTVLAQSQTGAVTITASSPPGGALQGQSAGTIEASPGFNEPGAHTRILETNFSSIPALGSGFTAAGMILGKQNRSASANRVSVVTNQPSGPFSAPNALQVELYNGLGDGNSGFGNMDFWHTDVAGTGSEPQEALYVRFGFKINGPDFQNQSVGTKVCYFPYANTARNNHSYLMLAGDNASLASAPNGSINSTFRLDWWITQMNASTGADPGFSTQTTGSGSKRIVCGQWHTIELLMVQNTGLNADGVCRLWIDGVLCIDTLKRWTSPTHPRGFWRIHKDEVWGGSSGQVKNRSDFFLWDHLYASGIPS